MTRQSLTHLAAAAFVMGTLVTACGGGETDYLTEEEFCTRLSVLNMSEDDTFSPETLEQMEDLADRAPTAEVRDAIETLLPLLRRFSEVDSDDSDALMGLMVEFNTPEIAEAGDLLDDYSSEVCGDSPTTSSDPDTGNPDTASTDSDDPYEQIDFNELIDTIDGLLPLYGDVTATTGTSMSGLYPGAEIIIPFDVEGDGMALCSGVLDWVSTQTESPDVIIRVQVNGTDTVTRLAGGGCVAA